MTVVCVDDHPLLLKGLLESVRQLLPIATYIPFVVWRIKNKIGKSREEKK